MNNEFDTVRNHTVIRSSIERKGKGVKEDPVRILIQYWNSEGEKIIEFDTHTKKTWVNESLL